MGSALKGKALIAYLVVCVFWGSTYLAIKVGVTELPPFLFAGLRFLIAGLLLFGIARALGDALPRGSDWRTLAIVGVLLLAGGKGGHGETNLDAIELHPIAADVSRLFETLDEIGRAHV